MARFVYILMYTRCFASKQRRFGMKAIRISRPGVVEMADIPKPTPRKGEALLRPCLLYTSHAVAEDRYVAIVIDLIFGADAS